jgi:hypothetical protein
LRPIVDHLKHIVRYPKIATAPEKFLAKKSQRKTHFFHAKITEKSSEEKLRQKLIAE